MLSNFYTSFIQQKPAPGLETSGGYERYRAEGAGADGKTVDDMAPEDDFGTSDYGGKTDASTSRLDLFQMFAEISPASLIFFTDFFGNRGATVRKSCRA